MNNVCIEDFPIFSIVGLPFFCADSFRVFFWDPNVSLLNIFSIEKYKYGLEEEEDCGAVLSSDSPMRSAIDSQFLLLLEVAQMEYLKRTDQYEDKAV